MNSTIVTNYDYFANVKIDIEKAVNEASTIDGVLIMVKTEIDELVGIKRWSSFSQFTNYMKGIDGYTDEPIYTALKVAFAKNTWPSYVYTYGLKLTYSDRFVNIDGEQKSVYKLYYLRSRGNTQVTDYTTLDRYTYSMRFEVKSNNSTVVMNGTNSDTLKAASDAIISEWLSKHRDKLGFNPLNAYYSGDDDETYGTEITGIENVIDDAYLHWTYSSDKKSCQTIFPLKLDSVYSFLKDNGYYNLGYNHYNGNPKTYYPTAILYTPTSYASAIMYGENNDGINVRNGDNREIMGYSITNQAMVFCEMIDGVATATECLGKYTTAWTLRASALAGYSETTNLPFAYCDGDKNIIPEYAVAKEAGNTTTADTSEYAYVQNRVGYLKVIDNTSNENAKYKVVDGYITIPSSEYVHTKASGAEGEMKFKVGTYIPFRYGTAYTTIYKESHIKPTSFKSWWETILLNTADMQIEFSYQDATWKQNVDDVRTNYTYKYKNGVVTPVKYSETFYSDGSDEKSVQVTVDGETKYVTRTTTALKSGYDAYDNAFGRLPVTPVQNDAVEDTVYTLNVYFCAHGFATTSGVLTAANHSQNVLDKEYKSSVSDIDNALSESMATDAWYVVCPVDGEIPGKTEDDKDFSFALDELLKISEKVEGAEKMAIFSDTGYIRNTSGGNKHYYSFHDKLADYLTTSDLKDGYATAISNLPFKSAEFNYGDYVRTAVIYAPYTEYKEEYDSADSSYKNYDNCRNVEWALAWLENDSGTETAAFKTLKKATAPTYTEVWTEMMCGDLTSTDELEQTDGANYNVCTSINGKCITLNGKTLSGEWMDVVRFRDWLIIEMRKRLANLFIKAVKIPYTDEGITAIASVIRGVLVEGQNRGGIMNNYTDEDENTVRGFTMTYPRMRDISSYMRQRRKLTGLTFRARLTGAIHFAELKGTLAYGETEVTEE